MGFNDTWGQVDPNAVGGDDSQPPEAGTYTVVLKDADAFTSKKGEDWQKLEFGLLDRDHDWTVLFGFKSQAAANFAANQAREVGVDVSGIRSMEELAAALKQHVGTYYEVEVEQNGEYRNTYIRGRSTSEPLNSLGAQAPAPPTPVAAGAASSDVPF